MQYRGNSSSAFEVQEAATLRSYLFNMNALFERFVARLCKEFGPPSLKIETQESLRTAYRYTSNSHGWQVPRLRPDIVVRRLASKGQTNPAVLVIDTKYKLLAGKRPSPADLYQLTLYSLAFGGQTPVPSRIVFPTDGATSSSANTPKLDFVGFGSGQQPATIDLFALSLPEVALAIRKRDRITLRQVTSQLLHADTGHVGQ